MRRRRVKILVEVDLDPVPGWGNDPDDYVNHIQGVLNETIGHYNPTVALQEPELDDDPGTAMLE